ncbi:MAG: hypothetical protein K6B74_00805 [Ruminococcus sp.]|nr:hypothetical protein [Ruminococcus sp.]
MSKKDKLKKQAAEQLARKRLDDAEESLEKERAKGRQSLAAKKMRRAARRGYIGGLVIFMTVLMLASFLYSGVVFGGFTVYGSLTGSAELIPHSVAYAMLIGDVLMCAGIIASFRGRKILQGLLALPGSASYLWGALAVINDLKVRLAQPGTAPEAYGMDVRYMRFYLPILVLTFFSLIIFIMGIVEYFGRKRREKTARENAPVKSIVDG